MRLRHATKQSVSSDLSVTVNAFNDVVNSECLLANGFGATCILSQLSCKSYGDMNS